MQGRVSPGSPLFSSTTPRLLNILLKQTGVCLLHGGSSFWKWDVKRKWFTAAAFGEEEALLIGEMMKETEDLRAQG